jgi:Rrf2 family protein
LGAKPPAQPALWAECPLHVCGFGVARRRGNPASVESRNMISYMKSRGRLSAVLHALLHMAHRQGPMTSDELAACLRTHPVVVRRTMASLRDAGFVVSERGHGGGWVLARDLASVTLLDVHMAVGDADAPAPEEGAHADGCVIEQSVQRALAGSLREAEALLMKRLAEVTLADLSADFNRAMAAHAAHAGHGAHPLSPEASHAV